MFVKENPDRKKSHKTDTNQIWHKHNEIYVGNSKKKKKENTTITWTLKIFLIIVLENSKPFLSKKNKISQISLF